MLYKNNSIIDNKTQQWFEGLSPFEREEIFTKNKISLNLINDIFMWRILYFGKCENETVIQKVSDFFLDSLSKTEDLDHLDIYKSEPNLFILKNKLTDITYVLFIENGKTILSITNGVIRESNYEVKSPQSVITLLKHHNLNFMLENIFEVGNLIKI